MNLYRIIAYITERNIPETLDLTRMTHINYAFGWVTEREITVFQPETLMKLREETEKKHVKLLLSLQQRGGTWFCQRSKTAEGRALLAAQARKLMEQYRLDGIDMDWEYPGIDIRTGAHTCDTCQEDFTLLLQELRKELPEHLLTFACAAAPELWKYTDFRKCQQYLDFINIMGYDYNWSVLGSAHQSNLYPGSVGAGDHQQCGDRAVQELLQMKIPRRKLNLGVPFYGYVTGKSAEDFMTYSEIRYLAATRQCEVCFDEAAQQSYLTKDGRFYCCYDSPRTIQAKAEYVKKHKLGGMMYWTYNHDDQSGTLGQALLNALQ